MNNTIYSDIRNQMHPSDKATDMLYDKINEVKSNSFFVFNRYVKKYVMIIVIAILISLPVTVLGVEDIREPLRRIIVNSFNSMTSIIFDKEGFQIDPPAVIEKKYEPLYIPKGYAIIKEEREEELIALEYANDNGKFIFYEQISISDVEILIKSKDLEAVNIEIEGNEGIYYVTDDYQCILWSDGQYGYFVRGQVDKDTAFEIANSVVLEEELK